MNFSQSLSESCENFVSTVRQHVPSLAQLRPGLHLLELGSYQLTRSASMIY